MFTGIITHQGVLEKVKQNQFVFGTDKSLCSKLVRGTSIAVNGVCLTVEDVQAKVFSITVMPETLNKTNLGYLKKGSHVNLELPATFETFLSGHIVQGHVDGLGKITGITPDGNSFIFEISFDRSLEKYMVDKGSVALNGISLTIINTGRGLLTVGIIPYTMKHTMLNEARVGDFLNIETDILAKYMVKLIKEK